MLGSHRFSPRVPALARFHPRQIEISMESVERCRGKLIAPLLELGLRPASIQANNIVVEIFGKRQPILSFANKNIAQAAPGRAVVNVAARFSLVVEINQKYFPMILETRPVIPGLAGFKLGVGPAPPCYHCGVRLLVMGWVVVKNPLAGLADNHMSCRAHLIVGLRTQHDLASHAFVVSSFGKAGPAMLGDSVVLAE